MSRAVITVTPETPIKQAARLLVEHGISALPVLDGHNALVGIVSEADLMPIETRPDPRSQAMPIAPTAGSTPMTVADVMTRHVIQVGADTEVSQAARTMLEADVKRVPVVSRRRVIGIVSRRDLVRVIARRDESQRTELELRLAAAGIPTKRGAITVDSGVVTIAMEDGEMGRRLAESVALAVTGVLEVRFAAPASPAGAVGSIKKATTRSRKR
jgi:CBS domain-containing protein